MRNFAFLIYFPHVWNVLKISNKILDKIMLLISISLKIAIQVLNHHQRRWKLRKISGASMYSTIQKCWWCYKYSGASEAFSKWVGKTKNYSTASKKWVVKHSFSLKIKQKSAHLAPPPLNHNLVTRRHIVANILGFLSTNT